MKKEISQKNLSVIQKYDNVMIRDGIATGTRYLHLNRLLGLSRILQKDWKDATKDDVENITTAIMKKHSNNGKDTEYTYDYKKVLKIFFRWMKFGYRSSKSCYKKYKLFDPPETEDIVMKKPDCKLKATDLISDTEREWLLDACESSRDTALIDMAIDGGLRAGEILGLTIGNVKQDKYGFNVSVDGKTGVRTVRLIKCTPSLVRWLSEHPMRKDPTEPLWINFEKPHYGDQLSYPAARAMIKRVEERVQSKHSGFSKRIFFTLFRHTEATKSAKFMASAITKKRHGWSPNSTMQERYSHLVNSDVDDVIFDYYGIHKDKKDTPKIPIKCTICETINDVNADLCQKCGRPLDLETAIELETEDKKEIGILTKSINKVRKDQRILNDALREFFPELKDVNQVKGLIEKRREMWRKLVEEEKKREAYFKEQFEWAKKQPGADAERMEREYQQDLKEIRAKNPFLNQKNRRLVTE